MRTSLIGTLALFYCVASWGQLAADPEADPASTPSGGTMSAAPSGAMSASAMTSPNSEDYSQEWEKRIKTAENIGALGEDLFGDATNFYNGATTFTVTDISVPGNSALPVALTRTISVTENEYADAAEMLGTWALDLPYMSGTYAQSTGWIVSGTGAARFNRCSASSPAPTTVGTYPQDFLSREYWRGISLHAPGEGTQTALRNGQTWATVQDWKIQCGVTIDNPGSAPGFAGEGFKVTSPQGITYVMSHMTSQYFAKVVKQASETQQYVLDRNEVRIYASSAYDRFGNTLTYHWTGDRLDWIEANENDQALGSLRRIDFTACPGTTNRICAATAHGRTWTYTYGADGTLIRVDLPAAAGEAPSHWIISTTSPRIIYDPFHPAQACYLRGAWLSGTSTTWTFDHPSGAHGVFQFDAKRHSRSRLPVTNDCSDPDWYQTRRAKPPLETDNFALTTKTINGATMPQAQVWSVVTRHAVCAFEMLLIT